MTEFVPLPLSRPERDALLRLLDREIRRSDEGRRKLVDKMGPRANTAALDEWIDTLRPVQRRLASVDGGTDEEGRKP